VNTFHMLTIIIEESP